MNCPQNSAHAIANPPEEIPFFEPGESEPIYDLVAESIGKHPFQPIPHFKTKRSIVLGHQKKNTVVHPLATQFPLLGDTDRVLLDRFGLGGGHDENGHLGPFRSLKFPQNVFKLSLLGERQGSG